MVSNILGMPEEPQKLKCFVISPIGPAKSDVRKDADEVLTHLIRKALSDEYEVNRADDDANPGSITSTIVESILEADLIVADLTSYNPNVYYEVAIAHGYGRPTVHIQRHDEKPAFDLQDMRIVPYNMKNLDELEASKESLRASAAFARQNPERVKTPLSNAKKFMEIETSTDPVAQSNLEMMEQLRQLRGEVRRAVRTRVGSDPGPDIRGMRKVIANAMERNGLEPSDLQGIISLHSSKDFDDWARGILARLTGETDEFELNSMLFDAATTRAMYEAEQDDDQPDYDD